MARKHKFVEGDYVTIDAYDTFARWDQLKDKVKYFVAEVNNESGLMRLKKRGGNNTWYWHDPNNFSPAPLSNEQRIKRRHLARAKHD